MVTIEHGTNKFLVPSCWADLTAKQLVTCLNFIETLPLAQAQLECIYTFGNKRFKQIVQKIGKEAHGFNDAAIELNALRQIFDFVLKPPSFTGWKFPTINIYGIQYIGPEDLFGNLTVQEFGRAEDFYKHLLKHPNSADLLNKFMACLYRPKQFYIFGKRKPFTEDVLKNADVFSKISLAQKKAIMLNFSAVRENLFSRFKHGFTKNGDSSETNKYGWTGIINLFCTHHHISPAEFKTRSLTEVLILFDALAIEAKERKKKNDD